MSSADKYASSLKSTRKWFSDLPQLPNEEDPEERPQVATDAPPPYNSITVDNAGKTMTHPEVSPVLRSYAVLPHGGIVFVSCCMETT